MKIEQNIWFETKGWESEFPGALGEDAQLVILFGSTSVLKEEGRFKDVKRAYPRAHLLGCSTAGEICGTRVVDDSLVATALKFDSTTIKGVRVRIHETESSTQAGERLAHSLDK
jgi:hypothetical protein